jgi:hypothetical protein
MTQHFRAALFTVAAIASLVACGCGSTATTAPATTTPATGTSSAGSAGAPGSATATTQAPGASGTPAQTTGLPAGYLPGGRHQAAGRHHQHGRHHPPGALRLGHVRALHPDGLERGIL